MAEFRPIFPAHAIERCSVTLAFASEVPEKALKRIVAEATPKVVELGLRPGQQPIGFQVDALTGKVTPVNGGGPTNFVSPDNQQHLALLPNAITWATQQYVRWAQFKSQFTKVASFAVDQYESLISLSSIQLEYWDRFIWTGDWGDFDARQLLDDKSQLVAPKAFDSPKEWHNHVGWFEDFPDGRRLRNVNVDVVGLTELRGGTRPSVGIYTMARDQVSQDSGQQLFEAKPVSARLDALHKDLKTTLKALICSGISERIGLDSGG